MIDTKIRTHIDPLLEKTAAVLRDSGVSANLITLSGFAFGVLAALALAFGFNWLALICVLLNRVLDGLDGALARATTTTHSGAFLDITLDFIFYGAFVLGAAIAQPEQAAYAAFLLFSFLANGSSFLAFATVAEKLDIQQENSKKSIFYLEGLAEGFETIVAFLLICLFPAYFWLIALVFGLMCCISATQRVVSGYRLLKTHD